MINMSIKKSASGMGKGKERQTPGCERQKRKTVAILSIWIGKFKITVWNCDVYCRGLFVFMERYELGIPKLAAGSNNLLWKNATHVS